MVSIQLLHLRSEFSTYGTRYVANEATVVDYFM